MQVRIRIANEGDLQEILKLFEDCVREICKTDYSPEEIDSWAASAKNEERWIAKINDQFFIVAILEQVLVGFASIDGQDKVDVLYVHKDYQRNGIASQLLKSIEQKAVSQGAVTLHAEVSKTARPFFEKAGFVLNAEYGRRIGLLNFSMTKTTS